MCFFRLFIVCVGFLSLLPAPVYAVTARQSWDCDASQLAQQLGFNLQLLPATTSRQLQVDGATIELKVCAPREIEYLAHGILNTLVDALPRIAAHVDSAYVLRRNWTVVILPDGDPQLPPNIDAMVNLAPGEILLHRSSSIWTIVHEATHFWSNDLLFRDPWLWEGYAEYLTNQVIVEMDKTPMPIHERFDGQCDQVKLLEWSHASSATLECGYSKGHAVFNAIAQDVGAETLQRTIGQLSQSLPIDSIRLLDALEQVSGQALDAAIWLAVVPDRWYEQRQQQQAIQARRAEVTQLASQLGLSLNPLLDQIMMVDDLTTVQQQLDQQRDALQQVQALKSRCADLGIACRDIWLPWPDQPNELLMQIRQANQLLVRYESLLAQAQAASLTIPESVQAQVAALDLQADSVLKQAQTTLAAGLAIETDCLPLGGCSMIWRNHWNSGDYQLAQDEIQALQVLLPQVTALEQRCGEVQARCREQWQAAMQMEGTAAAQRIVEQLDALMQQAEMSLPACTKLLGDLCDETWQAAFQHGDLAETQRVLTMLDQLPAKAAQVEQNCHDSQRRCDGGWRQTAHQQSVAAAYQQLQAMYDSYGTMAQLDLEVPTDRASWHAGLDQLLGFYPSVKRTNAWTLYDQGKIAQAIEQLRVTKQVQQQARNFYVWLVSSIIVLLMLAWVGWWFWERKRRRHQQMALHIPVAVEPDLLDELLAKTRQK